MHHAAGSARPFRGGFLPVPGLPQQQARAAPALRAEDAARGIAIVLETAAAAS